MEFGEVPVCDAVGAVLAHSEMAGGSRFRKGQVIDAKVRDALMASGKATVWVARLSANDMGENAAAAAVAQAVVPDPDAAHLAMSVPFTGRVNLNAVGPGIVEQDVGAIHRLNRIHPEITLATLPQYSRVDPGTLVGTVKIISYGIDAASIEAAQAAGAGALRVRPVCLRSAGLILTEVAGQKATLNEKGRQAVEGRLRSLGIELADCRTVPHEIEAVAHALKSLEGEIGLILTGSATSDLHDTAPAAIRAAGGTVLRFGMPVDPGNLLVMGHLGTRPVIGLPGCARSPALNGADWVLERIACGLDVTDDDIAGMGVGGLLKEIPMRPQPREPR
ncbi:MAG: molybdopterin-binding protein [Pseudomonadota bacterium]